MHTVRLGFDNPLSDETHDLLHRSAIADKIYGLLTDLEPSWSVRVGLDAPWGSGKTTISHWIAKRAMADGHIPIHYSPWAARTDTQLWQQFHLKLLNAFTAAGYKLRGKKAFRSWKSLGSMVANNSAIYSIAEGNDWTKAGYGAMASLFSMDAEDVLGIVDQLPQGKRFIIIIDDLDRVDPNLIPRFLLWLRDILDIKQLSFLLPFDAKIVEHALSQYGGDSDYGQNFLEKILDYRVSLKEPTAAETSALFKREIQSYSAFFSPNEFDAVIPLLPKNPRRLKGLARGLRVFRAEYDRHKKGEVPWPVILVGQMLKAESEKFFRLYVATTFPPTDSSGESRWSSPWVESVMDRDHGEDNEKTRMFRMLDEAKIANPEKRQHIINLCDHLRNTYTFVQINHVAYALRILDEPESLTWAEFDILWRLWNQDGDFSKIISLIEKFSKIRKVTLEDIWKTTFKSLSDRYDEILAKASNVVLASEHSNTIIEAADVLGFAKVLQASNSVPKTLRMSVDIFADFLKVSLKWSHFRGNDADKTQRQREEDFLIAWIDAAIVNISSDPFANHISTLIASDGSGLDDRAAKELCKTLAARLQQSFRGQALFALQEVGGISKLAPYNSGEGIKAALIDFDSELWTSPNPPNAPVILAQAANSTIIQKNALDFLDLLKAAILQGIPTHSSDEVLAVLVRTTSMKMVWDAAIATPLQFRRLKELRDLRAYFINRGINENIFVMPEWLTP